jgi:alpha-N-acetylgalactosaminidase
MWLLLSAAHALDNGLALTPPMGWMAWEQFRCETDCVNNPTTCISEDLFVSQIDHLVGDGWLGAGYDHINIDDCWAASTRDSNGELVADPIRFPHGIPYLTNYSHSKGVKLGIYNDYGTKTCGGYPGSEGYLYRDADTFARWEVDMLKMDGCNSQTKDMNDAYPAMSHFLNATGRPIIYSCSWPAYDESLDYSMLPPFCNLWRNFGDIRADWSTLLVIIDKWGNESDWTQYAGPGHWNDPDQLVIGMQPNIWEWGLSVEESRTQFGLWAILAAPLIMSNDLRDISTSAREILLNNEVIDIDQDLLGKQGWRVTPWGNDATVWVRPLQNGDFAVALMNRGNTVRDIRVRFNTFTSINMFAIRSLWDRQNLGIFTDSYQATSVDPHDTVMLRLSPRAG